jgi:GNAT superfamily N-acetyltransferase
MWAEVKMAIRVVEPTHIVSPNDVEVHECETTKRAGRPAPTKPGGRLALAATTPGAEQVLVRMQEGPVWVALRQGVMLATVAAVVKDESVYIRGMAVLRAARGLGAGAKLLQEVEEWALSQTYSPLFLVRSHSSVQPSAYMRDPAIGGRTMVFTAFFGTPSFTMENIPEWVEFSGNNVLLPCVSNSKGQECRGLTFLAHSRPNRAL